MMLFAIPAEICGPEVRSRRGVLVQGFPGRSPASVSPLVVAGYNVLPVLSRRSSREDPMPALSASPPFPLPKGWTKVVNAAVVHALILAVAALTAAWGKEAGSRSSRINE